MKVLNCSWTGVTLNYACAQDDEVKTGLSQPEFARFWARRHFLELGCANAPRFNTQRNPY